jgi:hypothetical protein
LREEVGSEKIEVKREEVGSEKIEVNTGTPWGSRGSAGT